MRISDRTFDGIVKKAIGRIPGEIRQHLDNILITVRRRPTKEMLQSARIERGDQLLGLFQGVPLIERSFTSPPLFPDTIYLFQEPLERMCTTEVALEEQIEITVVHEIAHYIGMDEKRLAELGYA